MEITINLSDFAIEHLGPNVSETLVSLAESEAERRWHIKRSMPKPKSKHVPTTGRKILQMFDKKRAILGGLTPALEQALARVHSAIEFGDEAALDLMWKEQIWQTK